MPAEAKERWRRVRGAWDTAQYLLRAPWIRLEGLWGFVGRRLAFLGYYGDLTALLLGAAASTFALAHSGEVPKAESWEKGAPLVVAQICVTALFLLTQSLNTFARRSARRNGMLEDACREVAGLIDEQCPELPLRYVGVRIWSVRGPFFARHLRRKASFFLTADRAQSGIRWTKGKGVLGVAWEQRREMIRDISGLRERVHGEDDFDALPDEDKMLLSYKEFCGIPQYELVYASPLYSRAQTSGNPPVRGVIAIDILQPGHFQELRKATSDPRFASIIGVCESALKP
jgi:hypothetical protein